MMALTAIIEIAPVTNRNPTTNCVALKFFGFAIINNPIAPKLTSNKESLNAP